MLGPDENDAAQKETKNSSEVVFDSLFLTSLISISTCKILIAREGPGW